MIIDLVCKMDCGFQVNPYGGETFEVRNGQIIRGLFGEHGVRIEHKENHWTERFTYDSIENNFEVCKTQRGN